MSTEELQVEQPPYGQYTGDRQDGYRHGTGKAIYPNQHIYEGSFVQNKKHGQGTYYYHNEEFKNGVPRYTGGFENGQKHGSGKMYYPDGSIYEGQFVNNKKEGEGKYTYANGDYYQGNWRQDLKDGKGLYVFQLGKSIVKKEGLWSEGQMNGEGQIHYGDIIVKGHFKNGNLTAPVTLQYLSTGYRQEINDPQMVELMNPNLE